MKHRVSGRKLGRNTNQRQALFKTLLRSLFTHGFIKTTQAKAKSIIPQAEKLAARAVVGDLRAHRELFNVFQDKNFVNRTVSIFKNQFAGQTQNFTRLQKVKFRQGDDALIVKLSFNQAFDLKKLADNNSEKTPAHSKFIRKTPAKKTSTKKTPPKKPTVKKTVKKSK